MHLGVVISFFFLYGFYLNVKLQFKAQTIKKGEAWFRTYLEIQTRNGSKRTTIPALPFFIKMYYLTSSFNTE